LRLAAGRRRIAAASLSASGKAAKEKPIRAGIAKSSYAWRTRWERKCAVLGGRRAT
jgi:hypothetical protein